MIRFLYWTLKIIPHLWSSVPTDYFCWWIQIELSWQIVHIQSIPGTQMTLVLIGVWAFFWRVVSPKNREQTGSRYRKVIKKQQNIPKKYSMASLRDPGSSTSIDPTSCMTFCCSGTSKWRPLFVKGQGRVYPVHVRVLPWYLLCST